MICRKCGSDNVNVISEQVSSKGGTKNAGCLWSIGRGILIAFSFGLWKIFGSRKETSRTKFNHRTVALCQSCGHKQKV